ncbi:MAG: hypothetical protein ABL994_14755 [Verrucomicrobiales bacterium]
MLKERLGYKFQARARESGASDCNERIFVQSNVLIAIDECGELSIEELVDALHVTRPSASGAVRFREMERQILEYISALLIQLELYCSAQWCEAYARIREIIALEKASELVQHEKKEVMA